MLKKIEKFITKNVAKMGACLSLFATALFLGGGLAYGFPTLFIVAVPLFAVVTIGFVILDKKCPYQE